MTEERDIRLAQSLKELAAAFISEESNRQSLITITDTRLTESHDKVTFMVSVFPENAEDVALGFLMRKRGECKAYLKKNAALGKIPHVEFALDEGERRRRRVDELLA